MSNEKDVAMETRWYLEQRAQKSIRAVNNPPPKGVALVNPPIGRTQPCPLRRQGNGVEPQLV